jgi:ribosome-binding factor A
VANLIRQILGQALLSKIADPRINPALTSVTRVEVPEDLMTARVYISVMGTEAEQELTLRAIRHASGRLQELMMRQMSLRNTPILSFETDKEFKKTLQTLDIIQRAMDEIEQKEKARKAAAGETEEDAAGEEEEGDGGEEEEGETAEDEDESEEEMSEDGPEKEKETDEDDDEDESEKDTDKDE